MAGDLGSPRRKERFYLRLFFSYISCIKIKLSLSLGINGQPPDENIH